MARSRARKADSSRYRVRKVSFYDLARTVAYVVEDTEAIINSVVDAFSESTYGAQARTVAMKRRDALNTEHALRRILQSSQDVRQG